MEFAVAVKAVHREIERRMNDALRPLGVTAAQADVILALRQTGPLSLKELGDLLVAEAGHPSRLVDRLVEAGLVERQTATGDRRRVELSLSSRGRRLEKRITRARQPVIDNGYELLGGRDLAPALDALHALLRDSPLRDTIARLGEVLHGDRPTAKKAE
jgi:DNA-binding MarR family transcriptional regulator